MPLITRANTAKIKFQRVIATVEAEYILRTSSEKHGSEKHDGKENGFARTKKTASKEMSSSFSESCSKTAMPSAPQIPCPEGHPKRHEA